MSKFNFSHLNKLSVTEESIIEYPLTEFNDEPVPVLLLRSPSESNVGYTNGILRLNGHDDGVRKKKIKVNAKFMDEMREQDRKLYPQFVITGWRNVLDADNNAVEFSVEACTEFVAALPNWIFDGVRTFASEPENFIQQISVDKGKNLPKG